MKVCLLIPDGIGIRNYLYSDIIPLLRESKFEVAVWHSLDPAVMKEAERINPQVNFENHTFNFYKEDPLPRFLRDCVGYARLKVNANLESNPTILDNWLPKKNLKGKLSNYLAEIVGGTFTTLDKISKVDAIIQHQHRKSAAYRKYKADLKKINPDILFCTHQREPNAGVAMLAAQDLGIRTVAAIFSWDNLPKGRLPMRASDYLVWSEYMEEELLKYFPDIEKKNIKIVGTPQFDFYSNEKLIKTREEFAIENNLDSQKRWICFSGDDSLTSPHDPIYLSDLGKALQNESDIEVLFRPVPVEGFERYQAVLKKFPFIKTLVPKWRKGELWSKFFPYPEDIAVLVNLAYHSDTVVNVGSTMALDFAQFNKPGVYVNYEVMPDHPWSIKRVYQFQHFRTFEDLDAVSWIRSTDDILPTIRRAIDCPMEIAKDRLLWRDRIVFQDQGSTASSRIVDYLITTHK
ncbi:glycosyltransferase family protein [Algoriphagus yeomjeoni]|uniref:Monogalactosyldiacylglycerol (MGDG) synthase n=1 Tax=Algoriphagus yeomjeoni TaxID=291403 RepID=A0A327PDJ6_9BACT|nr:hypothetical protein [Algoriphagus yeomjeoni]RAI89521.1 hypothetical protein LV83_02563 [Algoriphagus yeomjeoni]